MNIPVAVKSENSSPVIRLHTLMKDNVMQTRKVRLGHFLDYNSRLNIFEFETKQGLNAVVQQLVYLMNPNRVNKSSKRKQFQSTSLAQE
jgi:hypothetical protein